MNTDIRIFVSYRRADSPCFAERVRDWFMLAYQRENVFMDFDAIPPFVDFEVFIVEQIEKVDVMLVIIGPRWLDMLNERMKTDEQDFVRMEIRQALQMGKLVAPIVVDGARTPRADELPEDIRLMMRANIPRLDSGRQFLDNIERIISALPKALDQHNRIKAAHELETDDPIKSTTFVPFTLPIITRSETAPPSAESIPEFTPRPAPRPPELPPKPAIMIYSTADDQSLAQQLQSDLAGLPVDVRLNQTPTNALLGLIILTPDSRYSDALQDRIAELQTREIPILPLLFAGDIDSSIPYSIAVNQVLDMRQYPVNLDELLQVITPYL